MTDAILPFLDSYKIRTPNGIFGIHSAEELLFKHLADGYKDDQSRIPDPFKYKVYVPVHRNRSIETMATLYDKDLQPLLVFKTVRCVVS